MTLAAYCRYSSDQQSVSSIEDQLRLIHDYCHRQGWAMPATYEDRAISGAKVDRPGYQALLAAVRAKAVTMILCEDVSRLWRNMAEQSRVVEELEQLGVHVIGVSDGVDTRREGWELLVAVRGVMNQAYRRELGKRTHRGQSGRAHAGLSAGGLPYGYRSVPDGEGFARAIDPERAEVVRWIFDRYAEGWSLRRIAHDLNARGVPSPRGVGWTHTALYGDGRGLGLLNNELYAGRQVWNRSKWTWVQVRQGDRCRDVRKRTERPRSEWVITEHPDLRIIDPVIWEATRARMRRRKARSGAGPRRYLFSGLLLCGVCGGSFVVVDRYRYGCARHKDRGLCDNGQKAPRKVIEARLLDAVRAGLLSAANYQTFRERLRHAAETAKPDTAALRRVAREAQQEADNVMAAIRRGIITDSTKAALHEAEARRDSAQAALAAASVYRMPAVVLEAERVWQELVATLDQPDDDVDAAREGLRQIVGEIRVLPTPRGLVAEMQDRTCEIVGVAGAGFFHYLTGRPPLLIELF